MENPLCFGTKENKNVPICRRCLVYVKCFQALKEKQYENKKRIDAATE